MVIFTKTGIRFIISSFFLTQISQNPQIFCSTSIDLLASEPISLKSDSAFSVRLRTILAEDYFCVICEICVRLLSEQFFHFFNCIRERQNDNAVFGFDLEVATCDVADFATDYAADDCTVRNM